MLLAVDVREIMASVVIARWKIWLDRYSTSKWTLVVCTTRVEVLTWVHSWLRPLNSIHLPASATLLANTSHVLDVAKDNSFIEKATAAIDRGEKVVWGSTPERVSREEILPFTLGQRLSCRWWALLPRTTSKWEMFPCTEQRLERPSFAVRLRNSGTLAIVEGVGDHGWCRWSRLWVQLCVWSKLAAILQPVGASSQLAAGFGGLGHTIDADEEKQEVYDYIKEHVAHTCSAVGQEMHQKVGFDNYNHNWLYITQFMQFFVTYERCFLFTY